MGGLRAHHHLQTQGVTWVGACRIGAPCRLSSGMRQGLTHTGRGGLDSAPPPVPPGRQRLAAGGGGSLGKGPWGGNPLHSTFVPLVLRAPVARRSLYSRAGTPGIPAPGASRLAHTHTHTKLSVHPSVCPRAQARARGPQWSTARHQQHRGSWHPLSHWRGLGLQAGGPSRPRAPTAGWGWRQQVMGKHRVVPRGAGAGGVLATWRVLLERHRQVQVLLRMGGRQCCVPPPPQRRGRGRPALTSVDVTVRTRSRSSTSCLKVGLWEGTACQHSRMIMYLWTARLRLPARPSGTR